MEYRPITMVGELSEDGQWVWNGSEWDPHTDESHEITRTKDNSEHVVTLHSSKLSLLKHKRIKFSIFLLITAILLIGWYINAERTMGEWCKEAMYDGSLDYQEQHYSGHRYADVTVDENGAPYDGICYDDGFGFIDMSYELTIIFGLWLILFACGLLLHCLFRRGKQWNCGGCWKNIEAQDLKGSSKLIVKSTSASTKQVTSLNPQFGAGMLGGNKGALMTIGSTTSNVPTVLGRISATYQCKSIECSKINTWLFDTEVQVWSNAETGEASYDITGEIVLP